MRILIIDDDRSHGESLSELLDSRGHETYYAQNATDADWLFELFRFELAIVDYDMPHLTGLEVARGFLAKIPTLKTIVMSAREANRRALAELGSVPFLPKPIDVDRLIALVTGLAEGKEGTALTLRLAFPVERYRREDDAEGTEGAE